MIDIKVGDRVRITSNIKIGDRVRVKSIDHDCNFWIPEMDNTVGAEGTVDDVDVDGDFEFGVVVALLGGRYYAYPLGSLELVK